MTYWHDPRSPGNPSASRGGPSFFECLIMAVMCLSQSIRPNNICRIVRAIVVFSFKGHSWRRIPNIFLKQEEVVPSLAYRDSTDSISAVILVLLIIASGAHLDPDCMQPRPGLSVGPSHCARNLFPKAPTTGGDAVIDGIEPSRANVSAVALKSPYDASALARRRRFNGNKPSETKARNIAAMMVG